MPPAEIGTSLIALQELLTTRQKTLIIVSSPPMNSVDLGMCEVRRKAMGASTDACHLRESDYRRFSAEMITLLSSVGDRIPIIWLSDLTCAGGTCRTGVGGFNLYRDQCHLSVMGSTALGREADLAGRVLDAAALQ
jgi:hypothetical protein